VELSLDCLSNDAVVHVAPSLSLLMTSFVFLGFLPRGFLEVMSAAEMFVSDRARLRDFLWNTTESDWAGAAGVVCPSLTLMALGVVDMMGI